MSFKSLSRSPSSNVLSTADTAGNFRPTLWRWCICLVLLAALSLTATPLAAQIGIGVAKDAEINGREVTIDFYLENFAPGPIIAVRLVDDLDAVFGAGNFIILSPPSFVQDPGTLVLDGSYDGTAANSDLISSGTLNAGATAQIRMVVEVGPITDQGNGLGIYLNQASATATEGMNATADVSDDGTDPDPDGSGDPGDMDEDDPTLIDITANPSIGVAKNADLVGQQVTFDFYLENFGNRELINLSLPDDLDAVFGAGNYSLPGPPTFIDDPGTLTLNAMFNGASQIDLIDSGTLAIADTAQIRLVVDITTVADVGMGLGQYSNQVTATAEVASGQQTDDLSDAGTDPDPSGDGNPGSPDEADPTLLTVGENPVLGVAKDVTVTASVAQFDFYLENLGDVDLEDVDLQDDLDAVFGAGNYQLTGPPSLLADPGTLSLNPDFNGSGDTALLLPESSTLTIGALAQIRVGVRVLALSDQGLGFGNYTNQASVSSLATGGGLAQDDSDFGTDPDPNGNGDPTEAGENDPTTFSVAQLPRLGMAKEVRVLPTTVATIDSEGMFQNALGPLVRVTLRVQNLGNVAVSNISLTDDLDNVFGAGNYGTRLSASNPQALLAGTGSVVVNSSYNGSTQMDVLTAGASTLNPGDFAEIVFELLVTSITDQGMGVGVYENQATIMGQGPDTTMTSDLSGPGDTVDPDGNFDPTNGVEDDPTAFVVGSFISGALDATVIGRDVTFDLYLETLGTSDVTNLELQYGLDAILGLGNFTLTVPPFLVDDPGTVNLNASYDGVGDDAIFDPGSSLIAGDTAQIRLTVNVDDLINNGPGLGVYTAQFTVTGELPGGTGTFDDSHTGTDPDPSGDGDPSNFGSEDVPTDLTIPFDAIVGVGKTVGLASNTVTVDLYLEAFGTGVVTDLSLIDDLDTVFGAGNYTITTAPMFIVDPGTLVLNGGYDGSGDTEMLSAGSTLAAGSTAQIQMVIEVDTVSDQGEGFGFYSNQASVTGTTPIGFRLTDLSDDGTNPDNNGDGDPTFPGLADPPTPGEDDPTEFLIGETGLGAALHSFVNGTLITFDYYLENLGESTLTDINASHILFSDFGFGNFAVSSPLVQLEGPPLSINSGFDGAFSTSVVFNGSLAAGESARLRVVIEVTNVTDQGDGLGVYNTGLTAFAQNVASNLLSDVSDDGIVTDPNGNGDASDAGEDDETRSVIGEESTLGVAKQATVLGNEVTIDLYLENLGNGVLSNLSLVEDLDAVFGAGNYTITSAQTFVDNPGTFSLALAWDGSGPTEMILPGGTLAASDTAQIRFVVEVDTLSDQGFGFGFYQNQVLASSTGPTATVAQDLSDDGTDPDPNGNGNPADAGESDVTEFLIGSTEVGVAKNATVDGSLVTLDFVVENFGTTTLSNFSMTDDLDAVFGAGNYQLVSGPILVSAPRSLVFNGSYNGSSDTELFDSSSTQDPGIVEQFRLVVRVTDVSDQGSGLGIYSNQVTVNAEGPGMTPVSDISDAGTDPDPNGNDDPTEAGENDPTVFQVDENPVVGVAKTASVSGREVTFDLYLEAMGNADAAQLDLIDDLDAVFGAGNYTITSTPSFIVNPGTLVLDGGYDGSGTTDLLAAGSSLVQGATAQIRFTVEVTTVTDQGMGAGMFANQATSDATGSGGGTANDLSDDGTDPDPNGNDDPTEAGEDDATMFMLAGSIGDLVWDDVNGDGVRDMGEPGLSGVTVYLDLNTNSMLDESDPSDVTDGSGFYQFTEVAAGSYTVRVDPTGLPVGYTLTTGNEPLMLTLFAGEEVDDADFGYRAVADLAITKADDTDPVLAGNELVYSLEVTNSGPATAEGVMVFDLLPDAVVYSSDTAGCTTPVDLSGLRAVLDPSEEVPPVASSASGSATFILDTTSNVLRYALHVLDIDNITGGHIHSGLAGANGPVVNFLYGGSPAFDPTMPLRGDIQLTPTEALELVSNPHYVNIHTSDFPAGEIRGQIEVVTGTVLACDLGSMVDAANSSFDVTVQVPASVANATLLSNVAMVESAAQDPDETALSAPNGAGVVRGATVLETTLVGAEADLAITKVDSMDPVVAGTPLTYTLEVTNNGPSDALNVVITENLPMDVTLVSTSGCAEDPGGVPTCSLGTLTAGNSAQITVTVIVDSDATTTLTNMASVTSSTTDPDNGNNSASEDTTVETQADLSISLSDSPDPVLAGTALSYTVGVSNAGPSVATNVEVTTTLPAGVTFVSTSGCTNDPGGVVTCNLPDLASGGVDSFDINVDVDPDTSGMISTTVSVSSDVTDPDAMNNSASEETTVNAVADLTISASDSPDPVLAGETLTYSVDVTNDGPSTATGVDVTTTLPAGVTFDSTSGCTNDPSGVTTCELGDLAPTAMASFTVVVDVDSDTSGMISATFVTASDVTDDDTMNNTATVDTQVDSEADLVITKIDSVDPAVAGTSLFYTLEVTNNGPSDALNVVVTETLPLGLNLDSTVGCDEDPNGVPTCTVGDLVAGASAQITVNVTSDEDVLGTLTNQVSVTSDTTDPDTMNNSADEETDFVAEADLTITLSDSADPVTAGESFTYTVEVSNAGPSQATATEVTTTLAAELTFDATVGCDNDPTGVPTCELGDLAVGAMTSFDIEVTVDGGTPTGVITTTVDVASDADDTVPADNTASEDTAVDSDAPTVVNLDSMAGDGSLDECEEVRDGISRLLFTFSEDLFDPPGDTDPDDVTNLDNYQLVAAGPDRDLSTEVCGPLQGDDMAVTIDGVTYDDGTFTATLALPGFNSLGDEVYRLLACGSTSLQDPAGNPLDGDDDGTGGDDFVRTFRVERTNLLANGHFDCDLNTWVAVSTLPEEIEYSPVDVDDASISGSAEVVNLSASQDFSLGQCAPVPDQRSCELLVRFRLDTSAVMPLVVSRTCEAFSAADCTGTSLGLDANTSFEVDTAGGFLTQQLLTMTPNGTQSMLCSVDLRTENGEDFTSYLDDIFLECSEEFLFQDGFESGNTTAWSNAIP